MFDRVISKIKRWTFLGHSIGLLLKIKVNIKQQNNIPWTVYRLNSHHAHFDAMDGTCYV